MPYKDPIRKALLRRSRGRTDSHGKNWRQFVVDSAGVCCNARKNGLACGQVEELEFHAQYGEGEDRLPGRILFCHNCHAMAHPKRFNTVAMHTPSVLIEDVSMEIDYCGGYKRWIVKYNLDDSRFGCQLPDRRLKKQEALF